MSGSPTAFRATRRGWIAVLLATALATGAAPAVAGPTIAELVEVADIAGISASPSGRRVAFRVERPSIERNSYAIDWYVADVGSGAVRRVGGGGAPIDGEGEPLAAEPAVWSADERFIVYRALVDGAIGLWRAAADGSGSWPVVVADADVEGLSASPGGRALTYVLGPSRAEIERAERREYDEGILVDGSVDLFQNLYRGGSVNGRMASQRLTGRWYSRAGLLWRIPRQRYSLDLQSLETRHIGPVAPPDVMPLRPVAGTVLVIEESGRPAARVRREDGRSLIEVERDGTMLACTSADCRDVRVVALAWRPGSDELVFTTQDGHYRQALHAWDTKRGTVRTVTRTGGLASGSRSETRPCVLTRASAVCVTAAAVEPPRLEAIDLATGERTVLFDPNAALRQREKAGVEQLAWTLGDGREATGTILLPRGGARNAPLFVTYYYCPGFLRGGTGDEFPLAPLADTGFAVACVNMVATASDDAVERYQTALTSVGTLVRLLSQRGLVDPARVGMGGFSAGSEATMWVAMNSGLLAAAAIASPQYAPSSYWSEARPGRDYAQVLRAFIGLGSPDETPERWQRISPALNTERIEAPLLMQLPESEARAAVELYSRLAGGPTPVELYAFPDEGHVKMQPRHRQAVYRRGLDWFRYWLQDYRDPDPARAAQYRRWDALRVARLAGQAPHERSQVSAEDSSSSRM